MKNEGPEITKAIVTLKNSELRSLRPTHSSETAMLDSDITACCRVRRTQGISDLNPTDVSNHDLCIIWIMNLLNVALCHLLGFLQRNRPNTFVDGTIAILANQGVAHTLNINLNGNRALVIAYAVASLRRRQQTVSIQSAAGVYILNHNSRSSFPSTPPLESPFILFTQPTLFAQIIAILFHSVRNPLSLTNERWHPFRVVERRR